MTAVQHIPTPPCVQPGAPSPVQSTGRTLRWGVVATGNIAERVTEDIARLEDAVLQAVSSRRQATAEDFAERFGFAASYYDADGIPGYDQLFADGDVDVVYIASPHAQHYEIARRALEAGKHVLCEKSMTINAREAEDLIELARSRNLFLMEAVWTRFLPCINRIWELVASGELGDINWVQADLGFPAPYDPASRLWDPAAGGGALLDLTVYPLTFALGTLGYPETVHAVGTLNHQGVDSQNALTLGYASGGFAQLTSSLVSSCPRTALISGSKGWLRTGSPLHNPVELTIVPHTGEARVERFPQVGNGYTYELREVTRCIQEGLVESPTMTWADSLRTMKLFDAARAQMGVLYSNDEAALPR
ncbi:MULTISPECIES: Gfo/Idh/MocA family protein [unclassified Arthrobacter]|uniref:Gfo/Idh/MocA family protein n=1 Tax=unclassified Arthrobacter TaxID=235627 RepID=UPI001D14A84F|nr:MULTISPECIES: Gfo/Idh/MocA family oxidoreductase [unclassified Arthrobacter]MCC3277341.1 Gfo/Idh/MocA family oxidoreductase [Arthrobacter sp. zg-Y20]MCC9178195.1 Gfo/Idh/MocA family oxidoreductase [Arthrobacter sp. zg-Y750]MDK1317501.1 Gfo/Idh/MocA family oxidoreductase [Arthrobacter sp. zg.Y20]MDK1328590.1 Gfo/Idh/MocA family oxidoreductase [Arthrobacter sp. zg-Y1143]WIB06999.1 Gfo/Idh/MocA family oxidoreductase [Arthrobacter sp. zg-Y20]